MTRTALAVIALAFVASLAEGTERRPAAVPTTSTIDFEGFLKISNKVFRVRQDRLLPLEEFLALAGEANTLLLDTRSESAYAAKHLAGAVHLSFSDLTEESLARTLGSRDRTVLIYCNNNFSDNRTPFASKKPAAALNIPTFVSLWTYGYRNIYELGDLLEQSDPRFAFEGALVEASSLQPWDSR